MKVLLQDISDFDVISFDIFDTLLLRPYLNPRDLWRVIENVEEVHGFCEARQAADRGGYDCLDDAYRLMPKSYARLKEIELKLEKAGLTANAEMLAVWRRAGELGKKRVVVSDMYLPRVFLEDVLKRNGFEGWDGLYVSCEMKARKDEGALYRMMLDEIGTVPNRVLHIGDNFNSDVRMAEHAGIRAMHYPKVAERILDKQVFLSHFLAKQDSLMARILVGRLSVAWHAYCTLRAPTSCLEKIGFWLGGPLGMAYLSMVVRECRARKIDRLLFVARDGYTMEKIVNVIAPEIKTSYIYAPRLVRMSTDEHLVNEYRRYVSGLGVKMENVAVVDSISESFSAQRLLSESLGRPVFGFSLVALAAPANGICFLYAPQKSLGWCHLAEFLFMAPTPPIVCVENGRPVYQVSMDESEQYKIDCYPELSQAEVESVKALAKDMIDITPEMVLDYFDAYLQHMSDEDREQLGRIKNGVDASHTRYVPVVPPSAQSEWVWRTFKKIPLVRQRRWRRGMKLVCEDWLLGLLKFRVGESDL